MDPASVTNAGLLKTTSLSVAWGKKKRGKRGVQRNAFCSLSYRLRKLRISK